MHALQKAENVFASITPPKVTVKTVKKLGKAGAVKVTDLFAEFKAFIAQGNVIDLAIGIIIGAAFSAIVNSLVTDMFSPFIALILPGGTLEELFVVLRYGSEAQNPNHTMHFSTVQQAKDAGAITMNFGKFFQTIINFFMIAIFLFFIIKIIYAFYKRQNEFSTDWPCPKCKETVKEGAIRCPHCTAEPISPETGSQVTIVEPDEEQIIKNA